MNFSRNNISYIRENKAYYFDDIVKIGKRKRLEILVSTNLIFNIIECFVLRKMAKDYGNDYIFLPLGENDYMSNVLTDFHNAFNDVGITLVWIESNPKYYGDEERKKFVISKQKNIDKTLSREKRLFKVCERNDILKENYIWYSSFTKMYCLNQLKKSGAEVIEMFNETEDYYLPRIYKERKCFGILTNNPSLAFIQGCNVLILFMLNLQYGEDVINFPFVDRTFGKIIKTPKELRFPIINHLELMRTLKIEKHDELVCVSILGGNKYTKDYVQDISELTKIPFCDDFNYLTNVVNYVKCNRITTKNILRIPEIQGYMIEHPDLRQSIKLYLEIVFLENNSQTLNNSQSLNVSDNLTNYISQGIISGNISRFCGPIHLGSYTQSLSLECLPEGCSTIEDILGEIRKLIYPYLLNKRLNIVYEYRWRLMEFVPIPVVHNHPQADMIEGIPEGLKIFETIWSHKERASLNYVESFGMEKALLLYMLRYFYVITKDTNLCLSLEDFKSMFVTVFYHYCRWKKITLNISFEREIFVRMNICPRVVCLNMVTWFMRIYDAAKYISGSALRLVDYFPEPGDFINGSIFLAFYEALNGKEERGNILFLDNSEAISKLSEEILLMFDREFLKVIEN